MSGSPVRYCRRWESQEEELVSLAGDVIEVMTLAVRHPVSSELRHRPRLGDINTAPASQDDTSDGACRRPTSLSLQTSQQKQLPLQSKFPPLSLFDQEVIRTRGRPWPGPPAKRFFQDAWYPIWHLFRHMGKRKNKVVRRLEF